MAKDGKPFNLILTEAERATLEAKRAHLGLRSQAEVIRYWIAMAEDDPSSPKWSERERALIKAAKPEPALVTMKKMMSAPQAPSALPLGRPTSAPGSRLKKGK